MEKDILLGWNNEDSIVGTPPHVTSLLICIRFIDLEGHLVDLD